MKKHLLLITCVFTSLALGLIGATNASAISLSPDVIPARTYVIGTHIISVDELLTIRKIMRAAQTIPGNQEEDMIIYYKKADGTWVDSAQSTETGDSPVVEPPASIEPENVELDPEDVKGMARAILQNTYDELNFPKERFYSSAKLTELEEIKNTGDEAIDDATSGEQLEAALTTACDGLNAVEISVIRNTTTGTAYDDLNVAVAAAENDNYLQLAGDVTHTSKRIDITDKALYLDLDGFAINDASPLSEFPELSRPNIKATFVINETGSLTINDGSDEKTGVINTPVPEGQSRSFSFRNKGTLNINGGTFNSTNAVFMVRDFKNNINITDGTFNGVISNNGRSTVENKLTICGGTFNKILYLPAANTTTTISGGTFNMIPDEVDNNAAIEIKAGTLNISAGTFTFTADTSNNENVDNTNNDGSGDFLGVIVATKSSGANTTTSYASPIFVNITGGTFINGEGDDAIVVADHSGEGNTHGISVYISSDANITGNLGKYDKNGKESNITGNHPLVPQP